MTRTVALITAALLLVAVAPWWPYGFYMLLRIVVFGAGLFCGWSLWNAGRRRLAVALGIAALVFNPFLPAHLTREIWTVINLAGAGLFAYAAFSARPALTRHT